MRPLFRNLLLGLCFPIACIPAFCAQLHNPYDIELGKLQSKLQTADTVHQLVLLDQISRLYDYVDDRAAISRIFVRMQGAHGIAGNEAKAYLQDIQQATDGQAAHWYEQQERRKWVFTQIPQSPESAGDLQILAELKHLAGMADAADLIQQSAQRGPSAARWEEAARYTADPLKKFAALQAGLALDPDHPRLNLQLAVYYVGRQQLEKAQSILKKALAAAPDDFVLATHLAELHIHLGLRSAALPELRELQQRWPAPWWLQMRLAIDFEQIGLIDEAARLASAVVQAKPGDHEALELLTRFHERRHAVNELKADYSQLLRLQPDSSELWSKLAQLQTIEGDLIEARNSLLHLVALEPKDAEAHKRLAGIYEQLHLPQDARKELLWASSERLQNSTAKPSADSGLLSDPQALAAAAFRHPPAEENFALSDIRIQELYNNGLNRAHVQQIFYIGSEAAAESHRVTSIRYSPASEDVRIHHARIWKPSGTVIEAQEFGERALADAAVSMYYDMRSRQLRFIGLEKGDVAELDYSLVPTLHQSPYAGYFGELVTLASRMPARLKRYALISPAAQKIFVHAERVHLAHTSEQDGSRIMVWELHDLPALPREPRSPGITETSPYVHVSTLADWKQLGSWYAKLIEPQFVLDQTLQQELTRLVKGKHSDQEKITAIQEFVLRNTHYVALEFGIYSYKPYPVTQTFARRFGDCKDKASLMIALLRAAGIEAELALVRTRSMGDVAPAPASIALFDHAIVYVPKYDLWLDGTAEYSGRELPLEDQGALALTVNLNGAAQLHQIPISSAEENYTRRIIHAELTPQGIIHFSGSTVIRGEDAPGLRRELAVQEQQLDLFRQRLAQVFPAVELDNVAVHGAEDFESDVSVDFQGALNSFQHKPVVTLSSSWMPREYLATLAPASTRTQDLVLSSPWVTEEEIHVALPRGATVKELPQNQEITTQFGSIRLHYAQSGHEVLIKSHLQFDKTRINTQEYPAFRQFCSTVERSFRNEIVVSLAR